MSAPEPVSSPLRAAARVRSRAISRAVASNTSCTLSPVRALTSTNGVAPPRAAVPPSGVVAATGVVVGPNPAAARDPSAHASRRDGPCADRPKDAAAAAYGAAGAVGRSALLPASSTAYSRVSRGGGPWSPPEEERRRLELRGGMARLVVDMERARGGGKKPPEDEVAVVVADVDVVADEVDGDEVGWLEADREDEDVDEGADTVSRISSWMPCASRSESGEDTS